MTEADVTMTFGEYLRTLRMKAGYKASALAAEIGVSKAYLSEIERNAKGAPSDEVLMMLAEKLKLTKAQSAVFYDLAAETKFRRTVPMDIEAFLLNDANAVKFLRKAKESGMKGKDLMKLLKAYFIP